MWASYRDYATFGLGAVGFLHELVIAHAERPFLVAASLALMGLPLVTGNGKFVVSRKPRENGNGA